MIEKFDVSWTISGRLDKFPPKDFGNISSPEWQEIEDKLLRALSSMGTVTLDAVDESGRYSSLQVRAEDGVFLLTLGEETPTDWQVRGYRNPDGRSEYVDALSACPHHFFLPNLTGFS